MFFAASIALASFLAVSKITVNSAPVTLRNVAVQQACTLPSGGGVCTPLIGSNCTNTPGLRSLVLNLDADCAVFPLPDCEFIGSDRPVHEAFSDDSQNLDEGFQSVQCFNNVGTVNGITAGTPEDLAQEERDKAAGVFVGRRSEADDELAKEVAESDAAEGIVLSPPANCTEGPLDISPEEQAFADANGVVLSGPVTCTFDD